MHEMESLFPDTHSGDKPAEISKGKKASPTAKKSAPRRRRKKVQREVEDYYAMLGVDADAAAAAIKRGYIEKTKQYPPEIFPEEFEKIRAAYDTLKNDELRKEYNITRVYGETISDLLHEAKACTADSKRIKLLERAVAIDPQHIEARMELAYTYIRSGKELNFQAQFSELKQMVDPDQWPEIWGNKVMMLMQMERVDDAFDEVQRFKNANPKAICKCWPLYQAVYEAADCPEQLLNELEAQIQSIATPAAADIDLYTAWIQLADATDEIKMRAKAQVAAQKLIKAHRDSEDVQIIVNVLVAGSRKSYEDESFDAASILFSLALAADKKNQQLQQAASRIQLVAAIATEIDHAGADARLFPPVMLDALHLITEEFRILEDVEESLHMSIPDG
ncbi:MAG: DnaJ domain-containing protein, partial [Sporomusa sp.]